MVTIEIPPHYGWVILLNIASPFIISFVAGGRVMTARKQFDVRYPNLYGTPGVHKNADLFNQVQRGHQNMFETAIFYVPMSIVAGLKHPLTVAVGGFFYCLGCFQYQSGYTKGPDERNKGLGPVKYIGILTSLGVAIKMAIPML